MSEQLHTREPWHLYHENKVIEIHDGTSDAKSSIVFWTGFDAGDKSYEEKLANAHRIVACVNACAGIPTEQLETSHRNSAVTRLVENNIELLEAAKKYRQAVTDDWGALDAAEILDKAIAKAEAKS